MSEGPALDGARVLVVGDVMLDEYAWGDVARISPEAPVVVVDVARRTHVPGGAANVAHGIAALGGHALLAGVTGDDADAARLETAVADCGIDGGGLVRCAERCTTTKTRVIARTQQVVRLDHEDRGPLPADTIAAVSDWVRHHIDDVDAVILSDYAKGVVTPALAADVIATARAAGKPLVVDPKGLDYAKYAGATVITPNSREAELAAGFEPATDHDLPELAGRLSALLPGTHILITLGAAGMLLSADGEILRIPSVTHEVSDVTGAGDTVVATLTVALARGLGIAESVRLANSAAGVAVTKVGAAAVTLAELRAVGA